MLQRLEFSDRCCRMQTVSGRFMLTLACMRIYTYYVEKN